MNTHTLRRGHTNTHFLNGTSRDALTSLFLVINNTRLATGHHSLTPSHITSHGHTLMISFQLGLPGPAAVAVFTLVEAFLVLDPFLDTAAFLHSLLLPGEEGESATGVESLTSGTGVVEALTLADMTKDWRLGWPSPCVFKPRNASRPN